MVTLLFVLSVVALFLANLVQELLSAYYLRCVNEERPTRATCVAFVHSLIGWALWFWFLHQFESKEAANGLQAFICSAGGAVGTYFGLRKPGEKKGIT